MPLTGFRGWMARILTWIAGLLLAIGSMIFLFAAHQLSTGSPAEGARQTWLLVSLVGVLVIVRVTLREHLADKPVKRSVATSAVVASAIMALLTIALSGFVGVNRSSAYTSAMRQDLKNLVVAEESYFADSARYTTKLGPNFVPSTGVKDMDIAMTRDGFTASFGHSMVTNRCAIFIGKTPLPPATVEGEPACTPDLVEWSNVLIGVAGFFAASVSISWLARFVAKSR